jgi:hypothetical protein
MDINHLLSPPNVVASIKYDLDISTHYLLSQAADIKSNMPTARAIILNSSEESL